MKRLLAVAIIIFSLVACKKEKAEPTLTKVDNTTVYLYYKEDQGFNTENWFSADEMNNLSMPQISINTVLQQGLLFGYYRKDKDYGFYSPDAFPIEYGQENWQHKPAITFRKAKITWEELSQLQDENPNGIPAQVIQDTWNNAVNPRNMITHPHEGEVYVFRTADGKTKGMLQIKGIASNLTHIITEIWVAK
jgi:hypothetical protein